MEDMHITVHLKDNSEHSMVVDSLTGQRCPHYTVENGIARFSRHEEDGSYHWLMDIPVANIARIGM